MPKAEFKVSLKKDKKTKKNKTPKFHGKAAK